MRYERDRDGWWVARIPGLPGCHTQGRTLAESRRRIREALSLYVAEADEVELVDDIRLPDAARKAIRVAESRRDHATTARERATRELARTARVLTRDLGLSRRDAGELLGISHQRVQQLVER